MKRLSALDALFLYMETPQTPMHVASLTIFKPETPSDDLFERFRAHTAARLDLLPSYRRRLESTPLALDHPVWVEDDRIDLSYHIHRAALPKPGGMAELNALVGRLHAVPLDRTRPLWEYTFIEGLEDGGFAVYAKVHHCLMDGVAGMATLGVVYDFDPKDGDVPTHPRAPPIDPEPADAIELTSSAIGDFVRQGWRAATSLPSLARAVIGAAPNFARDARMLTSYVRDIPRTPFNVAISRHRAYATGSLPLPEVKAFAKSRGATVNDVVMALTSGALRRYLADRKALPQKPLTAAMPVSLRALDDARLNNQVVFTLTRLPTDVAEPLPRLAAAQAAAREAKDLFSDLRAFVTTDVSILGAPLAIMGAVRLWTGARAANYVLPFCNVVVSNVPGPRKPIYCVGAPATHYFPVSIPFNGGALNITVQSYRDTLDFGLIACRDTVPDVQRVADLMIEEFTALKAAAVDAPRQQATGRGAASGVSPRTGDAIAAAEAEPRAAKVREPSALARRIDALGEATEALKRRLAAREAAVAPAAPAEQAGEESAAHAKRRTRATAAGAKAPKKSVPARRAAKAAVSAPPPADGRKPRRPAASRTVSAEASAAVASPDAAVAPQDANAVQPST
jgi:WS/DGAT/MGAT family acyltransferase